MIASGFDEENAVLDKPNGMTVEECSALSVMRAQTERGIPVVISCWKFTAEEFEEVKKTGRIWLTVIGETMPPVALDGKKPF